MYGRCKCHLGPYEIVIEEKDFILHKMINMNCIYNIFVRIQFKEEILISMQSFFFSVTSCVVQADNICVHT